MTFLSEHGVKTKKELKPLRYDLDKPVMMTDQEIQDTPVGSVMTFDAEVYSNYFCVNFRCLKTKKCISFELSEFHSFSKDKLSYVMWKFCLVGFNSLKFDIYILMMALRAEVTTQDLKDLANDIIQNRMFGFQIEQKYGFDRPTHNHIDLIEVCPLSASLKVYGGRLHGKRMQDLPIPEYAELTREEMDIVNNYCFNDLDETELIFLELSDQLELRMEMGNNYNIDLRSKSDAQIAEAVIGSEIKKITGSKPQKVKIHSSTKFRYHIPDWLEYETEALQDVLHQLNDALFPIDGQGSPVWPEGLGTQMRNSKGELTWGVKLSIGETVYKMGMGGLHSQEKTMCHVATPDVILADHDVESYYPRIILNQRLYPQHIGEAFLTVYETIVNRRIQAKRGGDKSTADSLKITINGTFGKLGSKYSTIYSPDLLLQVTISGQLFLLKLIEMFELAGISVVSANTDGVVVRVKKDQLELRDSIIKEFEMLSNFKTEETRYTALYCRDVNNYIAVKQKFDKETKTWLQENDGYKSKGNYSNPWSDPKAAIFRFHKNPERTICIDAIGDFLTKGFPVGKTIRECTDVTKFVKIRTVKGGAEKNGYYLGKAVRYYHSTEDRNAICYVESGNKVPTSEGGKPLMQLPEQLPTDIDYDWYENEAYNMLTDMGAVVPTQSRMLL